MLPVLLLSVLAFSTALPTNSQQKRAVPELQSVPIDEDKGKAVLVPVRPFYLRDNVTEDIERKSNPGFAAYTNPDPVDPELRQMLQPIQAVNGEEMLSIDPRKDDQKSGMKSEKREPRKLESIVAEKSSDPRQPVEPRKLESIVSDKSLDPRQPIEPRELERTVSEKNLDPRQPVLEDPVPLDPVNAKIEPREEQLHQGPHISSIEPRQEEVDEKGSAQAENEEVLHGWKAFDVPVDKEMVDRRRAEAQLADWFIPTLRRYAAKAKRSHPTLTRSSRPKAPNSLWRNFIDLDVDKPKRPKREETHSSLQMTEPQDLADGEMTTDEVASHDDAEQERAVMENAMARRQRGVSKTDQLYEVPTEEETFSHSENQAEPLPNSDSATDMKHSVSDEMSENVKNSEPDPNSQVYDTEEAEIEEFLSSMAEFSEDLRTVFSRLLTLGNPKPN